MAAFSSLRFLLITLMASVAWHRTQFSCWLAQRLWRSRVLRLPALSGVLVRLLATRMRLKSGCRTQQLRAEINVRRTAGDTCQVSYYRQWSEKRLLDNALYHNDTRLLAQLHACGAELTDYLRLHTDPNRPVILSPLHMVSDVLASVLCALINPGETLVISTHADDTLGNNEAQSLEAMGVRLKKLNPLASDGPALKALLRKVRSRQSQLVIFADAPPEVTLRLTRKAMRCDEYLLFGRPARLHAGVSELARLSNAQVVFFGLHQQHRRLQLACFGVADASNLKHVLPHVIEQALCRHPESWLLWHSPSFFYFNAK